MCGIFGYYHYNTPATVGNVVDLTLDGLKRLEYRGYDSAGICITDKNGGSVVLKSVGNVANLQDTLKRNNSVSDIINDSVVNGSSIAHTRWATHGPPSDVNAHPHVSDDQNSFVVVHNGIINNFNKIREFLTNEGYEFKSLTDTEVVPKLCKYVYDEYEKEGTRYTFSDIVLKMINMLEGTYALLIKSSMFPTEIFACKKGSPLLMGMMSVPTGKEYVFSSDLSAIVDHTNKVVTLEDDEIIHIKDGVYTIHDMKTMKDVTRDPSHANISKSDILKGDYNTYMEKEIFEQPITLKKTLYGRLLGENVNIQEIKPYKYRLRNASKLVLVACGTSYHSCLGSRMMLEKFLNVPVYVEFASDFMDRSYCLRPMDICIFVSQSGETADTLFALQYAKKHNAFTMSITNKPDSSIARQSDLSINLNAGFEISVASTKAYTSQLLMFAMVALELTTLTNTNIMISQVPNAVESTIASTKDKMVYLAQEVVKFNSILFIGRGNNYATALESALKVKEIAYIHSEGILAGELKHGPLALLDDRVLTFVFATQDSLYEKMLSVVEQLKARRAKVVVVCNEGDETIRRMISAENIIEVPKIHECLQHIVNAIPMQILAYNLATIQGHNVDQPRNLAKSVTVSD